MKKNMKIKLVLIALLTSCIVQNVNSMDSGSIKGLDYYNFSNNQNCKDVVSDVSNENNEYDAMRKSICNSIYFNHKNSSDADKPDSGKSDSDKSRPDGSTPNKSEPDYSDVERSITYKSEDLSCQDNNCQDESHQNSSYLDKIYQNMHKSIDYQTTTSLEINKSNDVYTKNIGILVDNLDDNHLGDNYLNSMKYNVDEIMAEINNQVNKNNTLFRVDEPTDSYKLDVQKYSSLLDDEFNVKLNNYLLSIQTNLTKIIDIDPFLTDITNLKPDIDQMISSYVSDGVFTGAASSTKDNTKNNIRYLTKKAYKKIKFDRNLIFKKSIFNRTVLNKNTLNRFVFKKTEQYFNNFKKVNTKVFRNKL